MDRLAAEDAAYAVDAPFFLLEVGVHVQIERGGDVGVAEYGAYRLIVAAVFDASRGEAVAQPVEAYRRYFEPFEHSTVVVAIGARLNRSVGTGKDVRAAVGDELDGAQYPR